jgi:PHD/YefM family antitoxin component YafN of YafNO toxin-antitoxin module
MIFQDAAVPERSLCMVHVTENELRDHLGEALARLSADGDPVLIDDVAVLISAGEYRLLRELEDQLELAAMAKAKAESEGTIPYEDARMELGL